jgi:hypothetical protein
MFLISFFVFIVWKKAELIPTVYKYLPKSKVFSYNNEYLSIK